MVQALSQMKYFQLPSVLSATLTLVFLLARYTFKWKRTQFTSRRRSLLSLVKGFGSLFRSVEGFTSSDLVQPRRELFLRTSG